MRWPFLALGAALATGAAVPGAGPIIFEIGNVRSATGRVHVEICTQAQFLKPACPIHVSVPAHAGTTTVAVPDVPPGRYAAQVYHDENGNGRVDRTFIGMPREGVGFSRDAPIRMAPPRWEDAVFEMRGTAETMRVRMRYMIGASGPRG